MSHKDSAREFLRLAASGRVREAYDRFVSPAFRHHNQFFPGDRESLLRAMEDAAGKSPNKAFTVKHCYQDGDTVITHSLVERAAPEAPPIAVVHIFRFEEGKVAELWDLGQAIDPQSPNRNGPF